MELEKIKNAAELLKKRNGVADKHGIDESVGVDESVLELWRPNVWSPNDGS